MFRKITCALFLFACLTVFAYAGGVTNVKEIINRSSESRQGFSASENKALIENGWKNWLATPEISANGEQMDRRYVGAVGG